MSIEEGLKKIKFYDRWLWVSLISIILFSVLVFLIGKSESDFWIYLIMFCLFIFAVSLSIFTWGMIYHSYKRDEDGWMVANFFVPFVAIYYYFRKIRKVFKKGEVEYKEKLSDKEKEKIEHYKQHKTEIDKKENKEFMNFLKWLGIIIGIVILGLIIKEIFF